MLALTVLVMLAGCNPAVRDAEAAERQYDILKNNGPRDADELCAAAKGVAAAWLKAEDVEKWRLADGEAGIQCERANLDRLDYIHH